MTSAGLYTVDLSALTPWQQITLLLVSLVGSPVCSIVFHRIELGLTSRGRSLVL